MLRVNVPALGNKPVKFPLAGNAMGEARSLQASDIPGVAQLFQKTFRDARKPAPAPLLAYLEEIFLNHPWQDDEQASKVIVDGEGTVAGFIGVLPQRLLFGDTVVRTSVLGSLMSNDPQRNPLVGAKLVRSALNGPHDLSISESANPLSLRMWEKSGGATLPLFSLSWIRVLKPLTLPFALLSEQLPFVSAITPFADGLDRLVRRIGPDVVSLVSDGPQGEGYDVSPDEFADAVPAFCTRYRIRPVWDEQILKWLLQHAATKGRFGAMMVRLVRGKSNRIVGGYIYYGKRHGAAFVLQLFAEPGAERLVVDDLLAHAMATGFSAVRGRVQPEFLDALARQNALLFRRSATVIHTRKEHLRASLLDDSALITGLAAEAWTKLIGEDFS
jgi:hypothetical protein